MSDTKLLSKVSKFKAEFLNPALLTFWTRFKSLL